MNRTNILLFLSILNSLVLFSCSNTGSEKSESAIDLTAFPKETCEVPLNMGGLPPLPDRVTTSYENSEFWIDLTAFPPETCPVPWCIGGLIPLPDRLTIGDTSYEIVVRTSIPRKMMSQLPSAYRFQQEQLMKYFDKSLRYWFESDEFLRSPDGKFALPFSGDAPFVGYIDFAQKKFICFKEAFPPTGEELPGYKWTGVLAHQPKPPTVLWLFVRRRNQKRPGYSSHRVSIPLADPGNIRVERMKYAVVRVFAQAENEILCEISVGDNWNRYWARISTDSWAILAKENRNKERDLGLAAYSPDQSEIYAVYSSGLVIFDAKNGFEKAHLRVGYFNAFTWAVLPLPLARLLTRAVRSPWSRPPTKMKLL
jgi:hypothetical protein